MQSILETAGEDKIDSLMLRPGGTAIHYPHRADGKGQGLYFFAGMIKEAADCVIIRGKDSDQGDE